MRLEDIRPGMAGSDPGTLLAVEHRLVFAADDGTFGNEPWVSDGTPDGTTLLADLCAGGCSSSAGGFVGYKGAGYFLASSSSGMVSLWRTDGTSSGTSALVDLFPSSPKFTAFPGSMVVVNGRFFFTGYTESAGTELWAVLVDGAEQLAYLIGEARRILTDLHGGTTREEKKAARALGARLATIRAKIAALLATSAADVSVAPGSNLGRLGRRARRALRKVVRVRFARPEKDRRRALRSLDNLQAILAL